MCHKKGQKGECLFILNSNIIYYTKEIIKLFKIAFVAFIVISIIVLIKYTPQYEVSIDGKKIGYVNSQRDIDKYINDKVETESDKNIAFVDLNSIPTFKLRLVNRSLENDENILKEEIVKQVYIEFTNYAISINGKNKTYVASKEEAQGIVDELKKEYAEKYTKNIGIVQVYSNNYEEIEAVNKKDAKTVISKEIKSAKQSDVKLAKAKKNVVSTKKTKISKASNINGIKLSVKPISGMITSRFGYRSSPGGIGSTNHKGLDIAAKAGTPIYAAAGGTVEFSGYKGSLGKLAIINHGNGVKTYYGHCSSLNVSTGQKVEAGDKIAAVGKTGSATGYHLHLEVHVNGTAVNPQNYIY